MLQEALSLDQDQVEDEQDVEQLRRNCGMCGGIECVEKDMDHIYTNKELNLEINVPAHICSRCDSVVYEPEDYRTLLEAEEKAQGRHYVKVEIKGGKINKYSVH